MIKIAILDDSEMDRELMAGITKHVLEEKKVSCKVEVFSKSRDLIAEVAEQQYYDIFLLDMEMPDKNGLQVAKEIRRYYLEPAIVFVTNHVEHAVAAFEVNAFRYIPKRLIREKLPQAYEVLLPKIEQLDQRSYIIEREDGIEKILYRNIFYIRKDGKYITIAHRNGETRQRKTLQNIYSELNAEEFFYADKSYVVNVQHILSCKRGELNMRDGNVLPVSRPRYHAVREKILEYWKANR